MTGTISIDLMWWLSAVELPVLGGLFWLQHSQHERMAQALAKLQAEQRTAIAATRAALADYKLEVAQSYASLSHLKDVETRLTEHLLRIEAKLDQSQFTPAAWSRP
jgi:hypothetical protein